MPALEISRPQPRISLSIRWTSIHILRSAGEIAGSGTMHCNQTLTQFWTTITLILVLSTIGLTYEIAAGRVLAPFFGTWLVIWSFVIATIPT